MPPRTFDAVDDFIDVAIGATNFAFGPGTFAVILKLNTDLGAAVFNQLIQIGSATSARAQLGMKGSTFHFQANTGTSRFSTSTLTVADGWALAVVTKATGTVTPQLYLYKYAAGTWVTAENFTGTQANSTAGTVSSRLGQTGNGDYAIIGCWSAVLTTPQIQALAFSLPPWFTVAPKGLWIFDQVSVAATLLDSSGGGANQTAITGTTLAASVPAGFGYFSPSLNNYMGVDAGSGMSVGEKIR